MLVNNSFQKGVVPHEKKTSILWVYILKLNYGLVPDLRKWDPRAHKKWAESPILVHIGGFVPPHMTRPGTHSVLYSIDFLCI